MSDESIVAALTEIRNWVRAASYSAVKTSLQAALPDGKSRRAYQMLDGASTMEQVRVACKLSPNALIAMAQRWTAMGLMESKGVKKRIRLFDLADFDMIEQDE